MHKWLGWAWVFDVSFILLGVSSPWVWGRNGNITTQDLPTSPPFLQLRRHYRHNAPSPPASVGALSSHSGLPSASLLGGRRRSTRCDSSRRPRGTRAAGKGWSASHWAGNGTQSAATHNAALAQNEVTPATPAYRQDALEAASSYRSSASASPAPASSSQGQPCRRRCCTTGSWPAPAAAASVEGNGKRPTYSGPPSPVTSCRTVQAAGLHGPLG